MVQTKQDQPGVPVRAVQVTMSDEFVTTAGFSGKFLSLRDSADPVASPRLRVRCAASRRHGKKVRGHLPPTGPTADSMSVGVEGGGRGEGVQQRPARARDFPEMRF